jgi:CHAD domain-containing protein
VLGNASNMATAPQSVHPIQTLREAVNALEAAILLCLVKPGKSAVHRLRTSTRRIEAQLELLTLLPQLPQHGKEARRAGRWLKRLRRSAGKIRDLDVQRELIQSEASAVPTNARPSHGTRKQSRDLRRDLKRQREDAAEALLQLLHKRQAPFAVTFESLLEVLAPAASFALTQSQLITLIHRWFKQAASAASDPHDPEQLHELRKRAKLARYLAESAPEAATAAHRMATRFNALQQAGGSWHDWDMLARTASAHLGQSAELHQRFASQARAALRGYRRHLHRALQ